MAAGKRFTRRGAGRSRGLALGCAARRRVAGVLIALTLTSWWSTTALAQLDPLLFIKRAHPTIIVVMDTSMRMLEDGTGAYYDPNFYRVSDDLPVMAAFPSINTATTKTYRRIYRNLQELGVATKTTKYSTDSITAVPALWDPGGGGLPGANPADIAFLDPTRYAIAKAGLAAAVSENAGSAYRWGLLRLRQNAPAWRTPPSCDKAVTVVATKIQALYQDASPCVAGGVGRYVIYAPSVAAANFEQVTSPSATVMVAPGANTSAAIIAIANRGVLDNAGFVPAGIGGPDYEDRPLTYALEDVRGHAGETMKADDAAFRPIRNTVVVLITSGKDAGDAAYLGSHNVATTASTFLSVAAGGTTKRMPIVVIGVKPAAADEAQLQTIATNSGGFYRKATSVAEVTAAVNRAVQLGFGRAADFDLSKSSEFLPVSPVVGSVNLEGASDATGSALPNTDIHAVPGGQPLTQRNNVLVTAGFTLPGFDGAVRAFRAFKPVLDATKATGWKFVSDGTRLWPDLDGRPALAGMARTVADPNARNIYTFIPAGSGGAMVAFATANAALLTTALGVADASALITSVRAQPLGAVIGSMPGLMNEPTADPPPDNAYGFPGSIGTFAGDRKERRSMLFFGANDGMIHAVDARTGYEVWAFIPYNLLPKLRTLLDGQPVEQFDFFVDSSPKLAEVRVDDAWRSLLIIGEGSGGTFYQTFDVTDAGMGVEQDADGLSAVTAMLEQFDSPGESIEFKWAFPSYSSFNPGYSATFTVSDATSGGKVKLFGDLKSTATFAEKTVGFTWSAPAIAPLESTRATTAVIVGSGYFPPIEALIPARASGPTAAGNALYLLNVNTGKPIGNASGSTCPTITSGGASGSGCVNIGDLANNRKNALQADPTTAGDNGGYVANRAYLGDIDGKYWRFRFTPTGGITVLSMMPNVLSLQPIYTSSALLFISNAEVYTYFATGSDLLPITASGGSGTFALYGLRDMYPFPATTAFSRNLAPVKTDGPVAIGERPSSAPAVSGDTVFFTTTVEVPATPAAPTTRLYAVKFNTGGPAYDANGNGTLEASDVTIATLSGRATAPFIVDQHLYFATTGVGGANVEAFGDPEGFNNGIGQVGIRILSWREVR